MALIGFLKRSLDVEEKMKETEGKVYQLAVRMHNYYERAAKRHKWKTQTECQVSFEDLPEANKQVMLDLASYILDNYLDNETVISEQLKVYESGYDSGYDACKQDVEKGRRVDYE